MTKDEIIENIIAATNQSKGSVLPVLAELDVQIEADLKAGRIITCTCSDFPVCLSSKVLQNITCVNDVSFKYSVSNIANKRAL